MAKLYTIILVTLFAAVIGAGFYFGSNLGHSAGQVIETWNQRQETVTKTPPPLTHIMFKGGEN